MSKKGVSKIAGNPAPATGTAYEYTVEEWYPATPVQLRDPSGVIWELFKKRPDGKFTATGIRKKGPGIFTFGEVSSKHTYRLEAYLYHPEGSGPTTLEIRPQPASQPKITKVDLLYIDSSPGNSFSFTDRLIAKAHSVSLAGQKILFTLWEDDAAGPGHHASNLVIDRKEALVQRDGTAAVGFMLTKALVHKAMQEERDPKALEFYVTAEHYTHAKKASHNVEVKNPLIFEIPRKTPSPKPAPVQISKAEGSPASGKPASKKEEKGLAEKVSDGFKELWDWQETRGTIEKDRKPVVQRKDGKSVSIVNDYKERQNEGEKCFCYRNFQEKDMRRLVKLLKGSEIIWEGQALKGGKRVVCNINDKSFAGLTKELNNTFKKYSINTCAQKMHFFAQVCEETGTFSLSEEAKNDFLSSQSIYKGRGILQLTGIKKEDDNFYDSPGCYKDYADYKGNQNIVNNPSIVADNIEYCIDSGAWIWSIHKKMVSDPDTIAVKRWGLETAGKTLNELAVYTDKYLELISVLLNGRNKKTNMPNGWEKRKINYNLLKTSFFMYERFHEVNHKPKNSINIVTFYIYSDGRIEKYIPKIIKPDYNNKYKYMYHDKENMLHDLGIYDIIPTQMFKGKKGTLVNLINLDKVRKTYKKGNYQYTFNVDSPRKYVNEKTLASIFGAMLEVNYHDISCNGFSHSDGSSHPSVSHINGNNGDFKYLRKDKKLMFGDGTSLDISANPDMLDDDRQNKWINALYRFGWKSMLGWTYKRNGKIHYLNHLPKNSDNHQHHLHL